MDQPNVRITIIPNGPAKVECAKAEVSYPTARLWLKKTSSACTVVGTLTRNLVVMAHIKLVDL